MKIAIKYTMIKVDVTMTMEVNTSAPLVENRTGGVIRCAQEYARRDVQREVLPIVKCIQDQ